MISIWPAALLFVVSSLHGCESLPAPQLLHMPFYGYNAGIYNQPGYTSKTGSLYDNYYSTPFAYSGLGLGYGAVSALYH